MVRILRVLLGLWVGLFSLSGCLAVSPTDHTSDKVSISPSPMPDATLTAPSPSKTVVPQPEGAFTLTPTATPTPTAIPLQIQSLVARLDCGEVLCQVAWPGFLDRPVSGDYQDEIEYAYPYGSTRNGTLDPHHGVEFYNPAGTPVLAAAAGEVVFAGTDDLTILGPYTGFYGNVVILRHDPLPGLEGGPVFTLYAHLSSFDVVPGEWIEAGTVIGLVGSTGAADGAHLHFEVRVAENDYAHTTNPLLWFEPKAVSGGEGKALLAGLILDRWGNPLPQFTISLTFLSGADPDPVKYYLETYYPAGVNAFPNLGENFARADLPSGEYRLAFVAGKLYEFKFSLEPGSLAFFKIQLD